MPSPFLLHPPLEPLQASQTTQQQQQHRPSPKRKRGLPSVSTIPPTPPTSSPSLPPLRLQSGESFSSISSIGAASITSAFNTPPAPPPPSKLLKGIPFRGLGLGVGLEAGIHEYKNSRAALPVVPRSIEREVEVTVEEDKGKEEAGSPRSKVANRFEGLKIEELDLRRLDRGAMMKFSGMEAGEEMEVEAGDCDGEEGARKRVRISGGVEEGKQNARMEIPETPGVRKVAPMKRKREKVGNGVGGKKGKGGVVVGSLSLELGLGGSNKLMERMQFAIRGIEVDPEVLRGKARKSVKISEDLDMDSEREIEDSVLGDSTTKPIPHILNEKLKGKKRAGTPPLKNNLDSGDGEAVVFDPERAALTWHDDEITGHDPSDPDDDGEGINGIGFKPTAAEAYVRKQKRRQQMMEYRNREAKEARAKRSERRRGKEIRDEEREEAARRVRFMEEMTSVISTN